MEDYKMTYAHLREFCNCLNQEQLQQEVYFTVVDGAATKVGSAIITKEDEYFDHSDGLGTLAEIKEENPDDWEDIIADAGLCPKGTVMLLDEEGYEPPTEAPATEKGTQWHLAEKGEVAASLPVSTTDARTLVVQRLKDAIAERDRWKDGTELRRKSNAIIETLIDIIEQIDGLQQLTAPASLRWVKASERPIASQTIRVKMHERGTHSLDFFSIGKDEFDGHVTLKDGRKFLKTNVEWLSEAPALASLQKCIHCGSANLEVQSDTGYNDGTDEPSTSNHLITYSWLHCKDCGDATSLEEAPVPAMDAAQQKWLVEYTYNSEAFSVSVLGRTREDAAAFFVKHYSFDAIELLELLCADKTKGE